jgi:hypothetical protein
MIDHDDGSCFYTDSYNYLVYGGYKQYLGHSKTAHSNVYVYPDVKLSAPSRPGVNWFGAAPYCGNPSLLYLPS